MTRPGIFLGLAFVTLAAGPARADDAATVNATQLAGLFVQSCLQFTGDKAGLRAWAGKLGLAELPAEARKYFLSDQQGVVYDASNKAGKFVLVSLDGGTCSAVAQFAAGQAVIQDLEQDMSDAQITFRMTADSDDAEEKSLRHREYTVTLGNRVWLLVASTVKDAAAGQAMLTVNPH